MYSLCSVVRLIFWTMFGSVQLKNLGLKSLTTYGPIIRHTGVIIQTQWHPAFVNWRSITVTAIYRASEHYSRCTGCWVVRGGSGSATLNYLCVCMIKLYTKKCGRKIPINLGRPNMHYEKYYRAYTPQQNWRFNYLYGNNFKKITKEEGAPPFVMRVFVISSFSSSHHPCDKKLFIFDESRTGTDMF